MKPVINVTAAILIKNDKVLIAQRPEKDPLAGCWEFPGGKIEEGESPQECLAREMYEEFCINIDVGDFFDSSLFENEKGRLHLLAYMCEWVDGEIHSMVHQSYKWADLNELEELKFSPADIPFVKKLILSFNYTNNKL